MGQHLVLLSPGFAGHENDSTCIPALQDFVRALAERTNFDLTVLTLHYPATRKSYEFHGAKVVPMGSASNGIARIALWARTLLMLRRIHRKKSIQYLHSFWLQESALIGHWFSRIYGIKHLTTLMGQDVLSKNQFAKCLPIRKMKLITLSGFHHDQLLQNFGVKSLIVPWGLRSQRALKSLPVEIDILGVGSLIKLKRYDLFIDTISCLKKNHPNIKAAIAGAGPEEASLKERVKTLGLENHLKFYGELHRPSIGVLMSKSKILLHPSEFESYGMVFIEALAHNMCIVSRRVGFAEAHASWRVFKNEKDIVNCCSGLLKDECKSKTELLVHNIEDTVNAYFKLYQNS